MAKITIDNMGLCARGLPGASASFGPVLRQRVRCDLTPLASGKSYAVIKVPKGFVARHAVINVITKSATGGLTLSVGSNVKDGSNNQIVYNGSVAATAVAATLMDIDLPKEVTNANTSQKTLADDSTYIVVIPSAACADAEFEISVAGDFMLNPADTNV